MAENVIAAIPGEVSESIKVHKGVWIAGAVVAALAIGLMLYIRAKRAAQAASGSPMQTGDTTPAGAQFPSELLNLSGIPIGQMTGPALNADPSYFSQFDPPPVVTPAPVTGGGQTNPPPNPPAYSPSISPIPFSGGGAGDSGGAAPGPSGSTGAGGTGDPGAAGNTGESGTGATGGNDAGSPGGDGSGGDGSGGDGSGGDGSGE